MAFIVTPQHQAIFSWVTDPNPENKAAMIDAVAGSGKTGTLIQILKLIPSNQTAIFLAFNKSAATEIGERARVMDLCRPGVEFKTLNAMGASALYRAARVTHDDDAVDTLLKERLPSDERRLFGTCVSHLVSGAKSQGLAPAGVGATGLMDDNKASWDLIIDQFSIDPPADKPRLMARAVELATKVLQTQIHRMANPQPGRGPVTDFDDQLYMPLVLGLPMRRFDWLLVDEAQDLNPVQRHLIRGAIAEGGRLLAVGDPFQSIYQFRGADSRSMGAIAEEYDAVTFPLSITYRCPQRVVEVAAQLVPHLRAAGDAAEGTITMAPDVDKVDWRAEDMVLCRNNAPLVRLAYRLLRQRVPCQVAGRNIGQGITALIRKLDPDDLVDLIEKLQAFAAAERMKLEAMNASDARLLALSDKVDTVKVFAEEAEDLDDIYQMIGELFSDKDVGRLTLSSVHRAKGQERDRIFILNPHLMPSKMARTKEEQQAEANILYVALTRTRRDLVYVSVDKENPVKPPPPPEPKAKVKAKAKAKRKAKAKPNP